MASLSRLPDEIIILIAEGCDVPGKACLARANRRLNELATVVLHRYSVLEEGNSALYWAAEHGHIKTLERMRSCGAELNDITGSRIPIVFRRLVPNPGDYPIHSIGFLPLHVAAKFGQDAAVQWLLRHGARVESLGLSLCGCHASLEDFFDVELDLTWTPLHLAVCNGNLSVAKLLISRGAAVRSSREDALGKTDVLHIAALCNNTAAIEFLVGSGLVDVDEPDRSGGVALQYACLRQENLPAVKKLLDLGASQDTREDNPFGQTPMFLACDRGFFEAAAVLLDKGAPLNIPDAWREFDLKITNPFSHFAWRHSWSMPADGQERAIWEDHREDFIRRLAQLGASFHGWYAKVKPLLLVAADSRSLARTFQVFLDVGFDVNASDSSGRTPIFMVLGANVSRATAAIWGSA